MPARGKSGVQGNFETDGYEMLDRLNKLGLRILTLGMTPDQYLGTVGLQHIVLYGSIVAVLFMQGWYEFFGAIFLSDGDLLDLLSHLYILLCHFTFSFQWVFLLRNYQLFYKNWFDIQKFSSTVRIPDVTLSLERKLKKFVVGFVFYCIFLCLGVSVYVIGAIVNVAMQLSEKGWVDQIFVTSYFPIPLWAQWISSVAGILSVIADVVVMAATFMLVGLQAVTIETQCETLCKALAKSEPSELNVDIKMFIKDHIELIKYSKLFMKNSQILNNPMFVTLYMMMAIELLVITIAEPSGSYYFSIFFDTMNCFGVLIAQCWFSSMVTLSMIQSSYSFYAVLMILQEK